MPDTVHADALKKPALHGGLWITRSLLGFSLLLLLFAHIFTPPDFFRRLIVIFSSAVCAVTIVAPLAIWLAKRIGAMDIPGGRHIHERATPRLGGLTIWAGVITALLLTSTNYMPNLRALVGCSTLVFLAGLLDDIRGVSAGVRLLVQLVACALLIMDGIQVTFLPPTWWGLIGRWVITTVWIIGITNAVNFLDGIDGLVAAMAAGTSLMYFILSLLLGSNMLAYCSMALMAASLAFLGFNLLPSKIFLGDGGSTFLGFFLATLSIQGSWAKNDPLVSFFVPVLLLSVPIYDMIYTTIRRTVTGRIWSFRTWIEYTGRDHIHHRLEFLGLSRFRVMLVICLLNLAFGLGAITLFEARTYGGVALIAQAVCVYLIIAVLELLGERKGQREQDIRSE